MQDLGAREIAKQLAARFEDARPGDSSADWLLVAVHFGPFAFVDVAYTRFEEAIALSRSALQRGQFAGGACC